MKKVICVAVSLLLLLTATLGISVNAASLPAIGDKTNYAEASTFALTHTHQTQIANYTARYDSTKEALVFPQSGTGSAIATKAMPALDGKSYAVSFSTKTIGWNNSWNIRLEFARTDDQKEYIYISDKKISYYDAAGLGHDFADTATNGRAIDVAVTRRIQDNGLSTVAVFLDGNVLGEFADQPTLGADLRWVGPNGTNNAWIAEITNMKAYELEEVKYGDVDGDGNVGPSDATTLARYLANWDGYGELVNILNADVNEDGKITPLDVVALRRFVANWTGYDMPYIPFLNVVQRGVDNTGKTDVTAKLTELHATGKKIYYPNGTYLFNGLTLDFSGGVKFESQDGVTIRNSISNEKIVNFDANGNLIGLMQNHLETKYAITGNPNSVQLSGSLVSPPLSTASYENKVEFLPFWYNDFGLTYTLTGHGGWAGWYDWRWNHHDCTNLGASYDPYDPTRHPLLGWYRGDDPTVLDWQCFWLKEYGINQTCLINGTVDNVSWKNPKNGHYWIYQLLNNTPNANKMKFCFQVEANDYGSDYTTVKAKWWQNFETLYKGRSNIYCYQEGNKKYPCVFLWDEAALRYSFDADRPYNPTVLQGLYKEAADYFKGLGYDGVCILSRTSSLTNLPDVRASLATNGVKWFSVGYPQNCMGSGSTYAEKVAGFKTLGTQYIYSVATGVDTHTPHPSEWNCPGNTPALFGELVQKAVTAIESTAGQAKIITCYNMSEWAEGGPGLVPTVGDGFGYLEAIKNAIVKQ